MEKHVQIINIQLEDSHSPKSQRRTLPASQKPSFCPLAIPVGSLLSKCNHHPDLLCHTLLLHVQLYCCNHPMDIVWVNSGNWLWTGRHGALQSVTELDITKQLN